MFERQRKSKRQRDRETDRQRNRGTESQRDRKTERQRKSDESIVCQTKLKIYYIWEKKKDQNINQSGKSKVKTFLIKN